MDGSRLDNSAATLQRTTEGAPTPEAAHAAFFDFEGLEPHGCEDFKSKCLQRAQEDPDRVLAFRPGTSMESMSSIIMRVGESCQSAFLRRLPPGEAVVVLEQSMKSHGVRLLVRQPDGSTGWVSAAAEDGTVLWRPASISLASSHASHQASTRTYLLPMDFVPPRGSDARGMWLESLRSTRLSDPPAHNDDICQLPAYTLAEILLVGREGRALLVRAASGLEGWVSVAAGRNSAPLWRRLDSDVGHGIRVYPFTDDRQKEVFRIESESFDGTEKCLEVWLKRALGLEASLFMDIALDRSDNVVAYCVWTVIREDLADYELLSVLSLAVAPESRGQGIGAKMLKWAEEKGKLRFPKASHITLHVRVDNDSALRLYERCGFTVKSHMPDFYDNADGYCMAKSLDMAGAWRPIQTEASMNFIKLYRQDASAQ